MEAVRVIVVTARLAKTFVCGKLSETKFKKGSDWIVVDSLEEAESLVVRGQPQLLITNGMLKATVMVMRLRRHNPALKAGCISTGVGRNPGEYQYRVRQSNCRDLSGLVEIMAHYLNLVTPKSPEP